ncbi:HlyD family secretion protein [Maridesulfovibrio sp.]|uniref:HlyD family secretion protein n=1 Tax=unclassified Maridesulfovibrio TaxID=2794999 RepID=UPI003B008ED9
MPDIVNDDEKPEKIDDTEASPVQSDPVKSAVLTVFFVCIAIFLISVVADRYIPFTTLARVQGFVIPMTPQIGGDLSEVSVAVNQLVKQGDILARIDDKNYRIAVSRTQATLDQVMQSVGGDAQLIESAEAKVASAAAQYSNYKVQAKRVFELEKKGVLAQAEGDSARAELKKARASLDDAQANLRSKITQLGKGDEQNPRIREALANLRDAKINLERTVIAAPTDGAITDLQVREGNTVKAGQAIMTFISSVDVWVEAAMRENCIGNIVSGDEVDIALDIAPGRVFQGKVISIGYGVATGKETAPGSLPIVESKSGWLREPQRFPVIIAFADDSAKGLRRVGGQADLVVYAGDNFLFDTLGWIWIRLISILSYVR